MNWTNKKELQLWRNDSIYPTKRMSFLILLRRWHDELNGGDYTLMLKNVGVERQEAEFFHVAFDHVKETNSISRFSPEPPP